MYTDIRSRKITEIRRSPTVTLLFYDERAKLQVQVTGTATIRNQDALCAEIWSKLPPQGRCDYLAANAPGTPLPDPFQGHQIFPPETASYDHFATLDTKAHYLQVLQLTQGGHYRAEYHHQETGQWRGRWIAP